MLKIRNFFRFNFKFFPKKKRQDPFEIKKPTYSEESSTLYSVFLLAIPVSSFGLGCWQVRRRQWKLGLIKSIEDNISAPPVDFPDNLRDLAKMEYRSVKVRGHFIHEDEILMGPRSLIESGGDKHSSFYSDPKKNQGWLIVTPFKLHDRDEKILINRGWVPKNIKAADKRPETLIQGEVELTGIVRKTEKRPQFVPKNIPSQGAWFYRDLDEMGELVGSAPVCIDACGNANDLPIPNQTRVNIRNEHFSYIITWFGLSGITSWMWIRQFVYKLPLL